MTQWLRCCACALSQFCRRLKDKTVDGGKRTSALLLTTETEPKKWAMEIRESSGRSETRRSFSILILASIRQAVRLAP